ncbi:MAG: nitroreductase [Candidatus Latescibacteria bacterium]|jgi:nitroreductase|nr:nitroreductase [Candidatus Latescibacterota bacterium]
MDVLEAIRSRRSIFRFKGDPIPNEDLEGALSYGIWAPNHHLTEPWRFSVLGPATKEKLAQRYREIQIAKVKGPVDEENREKIGQAGYDKFMSKPTIVAVSSLRGDDEQQVREDYAAACCAIQNIQLAAWGKGIGIQWSTGPITMEEDTYALLGIDPSQEDIIGFLYMGYPAETPTSKRGPVTEVLRWTE